MADARFGKHPERGASDRGGEWRDAAMVSVAAGRMIMRELLRRAERGQGLVEYALIIALVAVVVIAALVLLGPAISSIFMTISSAL